MLLDLLHADLRNADEAHGSLHILQGVLTDHPIICTLFMFLRWMHPDHCTQLTALHNCSHWTAHQKRLNSLCTTMLHDRRASCCQAIVLLFLFYFFLSKIKSDCMRLYDAQYDAVLTLHQYGCQLLEIVLWGVCVGGKCNIDQYILAGREYFSSEVRK